MKTNIAKVVAVRKRRVLDRLAAARENRFVREFENPNPVIGSDNVEYELSGRIEAFAHGGVRSQRTVPKTC